MSICPTTKTVHILLGQERYVRGWSGSNKVSGFEGGNKHAESPELNAARECNEETLGLVYGSQDSCSIELQNGNYVMRITVGSPSKNHITYLTLVPWITDIGSKFREIRAFLIELDSVASQFNALSRRMQVLEATDEHEDEDGWTVCGLSNANVAQCRRLRTIMEDMMNSSPHGAHSAISVFRNDAGVIHRVSINADHLEKSDIKYVSVHAAHRLLHQRRAIIRPFFRPVLAAICAQMKCEQSLIDRKGPLSDDVAGDVRRPPALVVIKKTTKRHMERHTDPL